MYLDFILGRVLRAKNEHACAARTLSWNACGADKHAAVFFSFRPYLLQKMRMYGSHQDLRAVLRKTYSHEQHAEKPPVVSIRYNKWCWISYVRGFLLNLRIDLGSSLFVPWRRSVEQSKLLVLHGLPGTRWPNLKKLEPRPRDGAQRRNQMLLISLSR